MEQIIKKAIQDSGETIAEIFRQTGVAQPVIHRFVHDERGLTLQTAGRLIEYLGLELRKRACRPESTGETMNHSHDDVLTVAATLLSQDPLLWQMVDNRKKGYIDFRPKNWEEWLPSLAKKTRDKEPNGWWIYVRLEAKTQTYFVDVEPFENEERRSEIVKTLRDVATACGFRKRKERESLGIGNVRVTGAMYLSDTMQPTLDALFLKLERLASFLWHELRPRTGSDANRIVRC